jgi:hypothetical protein
VLDTSGGDAMTAAATMLNAGGGATTMGGGAAPTAAAQTLAGTALQRLRGGCPLDCTGTSRLSLFPFPAPINWHLAGVRPAVSLHRLV